MNLRGGAPALVLLLLAPVGCKQPKGVELDPSVLIPANADAAGGFKLDPLRSSPLGSVLGAAVRSDADMAGAMDGVSACKLGLDGLEGFIATDVEHDDRVLVSIHAKGIGDEDMVRCIEKEMRKASGEKSGLIVFETRGDIRITPQEDGGSLVILNKDTLVMVDAHWEEEVLTAIADPSARVTDSALAKAIARVDPAADAWFSMTLSESERAELSDVPGADGVHSVNATLDLGEKIGLDLDFSFLEEEKAALFRTAVAELITGMHGEFEELGVPKVMLDSITFGGEGTQVLSHAEAPNDVLPQLMVAMSAMME